MQCSNAALCPQDTLRECAREDKHCLTYLPAISPIYFVTFVLVAQFVLVNVVVAVLMKHLEESNKEAKDQTTKNSLESEFSVLPGGVVGGGHCEGTGCPAGPPSAAADLQSRGGEQGAGRTCGRCQGSRGTPPGPLQRHGVVQRPCGGSYRPFFQMMPRV